MPALKKIYDFIGVDETSDDFKLKKENGHNIGGSPHRFDKEQDKISLDTRWKINFSNDELRRCNMICGILNTILGYSHIG